MGVPSIPLQGWSSRSRRNWAPSKPSAKSKSCSLGHTIAVISQDDGSHDDLEQTTPKAICKRELAICRAFLSAEFFVRRIHAERFHSRFSDNGQSTEQICRGTNKGKPEAVETRWQTICREKSKGKVTESSLCSGVLFSPGWMAVRGVVIHQGTRHTRHTGLLSGGLFAKGLEVLCRKVVRQSEAEALVEHGCPPGC